MISFEASEKNLIITPTFLAIYKIFGYFYLARELLPNPLAVSSDHGGPRTCNLWTERLGLTHSTTAPLSTHDKCVDLIGTMRTDTNYTLRRTPNRR